MEKLIQTEICSIIYGEHDGKPNQELFRCPRALDDKDLVRYIKENRPLLGFENDNTEDLREIPGKKLVGYWRMYYRNGWAGRWMYEGSDRPDAVDCMGVNKIIDWVCDTFPNGCDFYMQDYCSLHYDTWGDPTRYLIKPLRSDIYKVMIDTKYGNGDYPIRVYVYKDVRGNVA